MLRCFYTSFYRYNSSASGNILQPPISLIVSDTTPSTEASFADQALVEWLQNLQLDEISIERVNIVILIHYFILFTNRLN